MNLFYNVFVSMVGRGGKGEFMKKLLIILVFTLFLSGCSLFADTNGTEDYVDKATQYIQELSNFAQEAPQMAADAATNRETYKQLNEQVIGLIKKIEQFNELHVPSVAEEVHQQIVEKNEDLLTELKDTVQNGQVTLHAFVNSETFQTISDIVKLLVLINQLTGVL